LHASRIDAVLHRLEREGLIVSTWRESEVGRRRKYYGLTVAGRGALAAEKRDWMVVHHLLERLWTQNPPLS
jgi:DNA-binding PadR family transcriptional regulator